MLPKKELNLSDYQNKVVFVKKDGRIFSFRMETDEVTEIDAEDSSGSSILNAIYVGKIKSIAKNLNAAFVEYQKGQMAYLDLTGVDVSQILNRQNPKAPAQGDELLIQIVKEPLKTKDAVASTNLTLGGTFAVVSSGRKTLNFSRQLDPEFCRQLKTFLRQQDKANPSRTKSDTQPEPGAIIRTNAGTLSEDQFGIVAEELRSLKAQLLEIINKGRTRSAFTCLYQEHSFVQKKCKDIPIGKTDLVVTDDAAIYHVLKTFENLPVKLYQDDKVPLFGLLRLGKVLDEACSKKVWLKCGGYLVIEVTEALTVIDVNSGKCVVKKKKDDLVRLINEQAAAESMRQIRLRNISGIILIDFMKYDDPEREQHLIRYMRSLAGEDKVQTDVVDMTALGLLEMTRKKISKPLHEKL